MNILWVIENNRYNANYKIAIRLAKQMSKRHTLFCLAYLGSEIEDFSDLKAVFVKVESLGGSKSKELKHLLEMPEWREKDKIQKAKYILTHPSLCALIFEKRLSQRKSRCISQIESFCRTNKIDIIIGAVFPYEIAQCVAKVNFDIPKYILQLDPYSTNGTLSNNLRKKRERIERRVLEDISVLFATSIIINELTNKYNKLNCKMIPIEFPELAIDNQEEYLVNGENSVLSRKNGFIYLLHAGTFYEDIRNPKYLVKLISGLPNNYKLVVAGVNTSMIHKYDAGFEDRILDLGLLPQNIVSILKREVDALICFNNLVNNQVPSKLFECIETGRPFINLCQLTSCPTIPYVKNYGNACSVFVHLMNSKDIVRFIESHKNITIPRETILSQFYKNTVEYVSQQIEEEIRNDKF